MRVQLSPFPSPPGRTRTRPGFPRSLERRMSDVDTFTGKVVVNRVMSLDGFIAGPGHAMDWIFEYMTADTVPEVMAATGAMLIGRGTYEVGKRMADQNTSYDGG